MKIKMISIKFELYDGGGESGKKQFCGFLFISE